MAANMPPLRRATPILLLDARCQTMPNDVPGATGTFAESITPLGDIVGLYQDSSGNDHGFLLSK